MSWWGCDPCDMIKSYREKDTRDQGTSLLLCLHSALLLLLPFHQPLWHVIGQWESRYLKARKRILTRNWPCSICSQTHSQHNCEKMNFCFISHSAGVCYGSPSWQIQNTMSSTNPVVMDHRAGSENRGIPPSPPKSYKNTQGSGEKNTPKSVKYRGWGTLHNKSRLIAHAFLKEGAEEGGCCCLGQNCVRDYENVYWQSVLAEWLVTYCGE